MNRSAHIREIAKSCGLKQVEVERLAIRAFSPSDDCDGLTPEAAMGAVALLRGHIRELREQIARLSGGRKRRLYPKSYEDEINRPSGA